MFERRGTLLRPPRRFQGCPRWKGLFKESPISIRARWKPKGAHESDGGYHIHISVYTSASSHTHTDASLSFIPSLHSFFLLLSFTGSRPLLPLILLWEEDPSTVLFFIGHSCYLAGEFAHFSLLHNLSDFPLVINTAPI